MHTEPRDSELRDSEQREGAPPHRASASASASAGTESHLALHVRLALSALVAGVTLWIRVAEIVPDRRGDVNRR
jgi:hypothetical protein